MTLPVSAFFAAAATPGRAIVLTTFSLDEQVLVELLREHSVPTDQRIVVFHDVMKHHAPGFLRQHFADSLVVSVQIVHTRGPANSCPVFHSKLWLAVEKRPLLCRVLAVPSLNLRRFHLDEAYRTFDTFPWWSDLALQLDELGWMSRELMFDRRGHVRRKVPCATVLVDATNGRPTRLSSKCVPAIQVIQNVLDGEEPLGCAAPFVSGRAIEKLFPDATEAGRRPLVWMGTRSDGMCLHAKVVESRKRLVLGSTNLTCQALGIGKFLNHETVVVASRGKLRLSKVLWGFPREDYCQLRAPEEPGDLDEADAAGERWEERRRLAIAGPTQVLLILIAGRPALQFVGALSGVSRVVIASKRDDAPPPIDMAAKNRLRFLTHESQVQLAEHVFGPPVEVRGVRKGKTVWTRELDCGSFWVVLEANSRKLADLRSALQKTRRRGKRPPRRQTMSYSDVRNSRRTAFQDPQLGHEEREWQGWLTRLSTDLPVHGIPGWCIDLAKRIRGDGDA